MLKELGLPQASIRYDDNFLDSQLAARFFQSLKAEVLWQQEDIFLFGKSIPQPRLTAWYGSEDYCYSGLVMKAQPWSATLLDLKMRAEMATGFSYNSVLLNFYRNGQDSMSWHSDDEAELGPEPAIASVSLGEQRMFHFRHKLNKQLKHRMRLANGSLLVMAGQTQRYWQHQLPKTRRFQSERINLTFRYIFPELGKANR